MASGGAFGGARGYQPKPPEKGVFPLDHFGECKQIKEQYIECLKKNANDANACRDVAKQYLECRMDRNLMAVQDLKDLGFSETDKAKARKQQSAEQQKQKKESTGFIAGLHTTTK